MYTVMSAYIFLQLLYVHVHLQQRNLRFDTQTAQVNKIWQLTKHYQQKNTFS